MGKIRFFDTTLRDGEQTPGVNFNREEKLDIAKRLEKLGVDVIEAGFAAASEGDLNAIREIAKNVKESYVCSLARATKAILMRRGRQLSWLKIHIFIRLLQRAIYI